MWNSFAKLARLEKAIEYSGGNPNRINVEELFYLLRKRGATDTKLNEIAYQLLGILEPPGCPMGHCKHYGGQGAFANCGLGRVPGRCPDLRSYKKRTKKRQKNVAWNPGDKVCDRGNESLAPGVVDSIGHDGLVSVWWPDGSGGDYRAEDLVAPPDVPDVKELPCAKSSTP